MQAVSPQSALDPRGREALLLHDLDRVMVVGAALVFALVTASLLAAIWVGPRRPPSAVPPPPADVAHPKAKLRAIVMAAVTTALLLVSLLAYEYRIIGQLTANAGEGLPIRVVAHQWWWEVTYLEGESVLARTANEIHVPVGKPVSLELQSRDVIHSFWVPNLQGKVDAIPGRTNNLTFQADSPGTYRGQCAEFCGLQHAKMALFVVAEAPDEFERWLARQRAPAAAPRDALAQTGERVFASSSCPLCHSVRGTLAMASVAPDLTHVGSRFSLAAGSVENTLGNLGSWVLDPHTHKPGTRMPATHLDADRVEALIHYLDSLK